MTGDDRRTHFRLPKQAEVTCQQILYPLGQAPEVSVRMVDVSEGGLKFESSMGFEEGALLQVAVKLEGWQRHTSSFLKYEEDALFKPLTAVTRVIRCVQKCAGAYEVGAQFVDIWDDHWQAVRRLLHAERERGESPDP